MKKFKFELQRVHEYTLHMQKREKDKLAELRHEYDELNNQMIELKHKYNTCKQKQIKECFDGISIMQLILSNTYLNQLAAKILLLKKEITEMEIKIEDQIQVLLAVTKEKTTLDKLKDKHLERYNSLERKQNELFIDEFVANKASS